MRILFICLLIFNCQSQNEIDTVRNIETEVKERLRSWKLETKVSAKTLEEDTLDFTIHYIKKTEFNEKAPYYYDKQTNEVIVKALLYSIKDKIAKYENIKIHLTFDGSPDIADFDLDKEKIDRISLFFKHPIFYENVIYSLENFDYDDITSIKSVVKYINEGVKKFNLNLEDNYWSLLESYSAFCSTSDISDEKVKKKELFIVSISAITNYHKDHFEKSIINNLNNLITRCGNG